jgi:hypothetical protein
VKGHQPARNEMNMWILKADEELVHVARRKHLEVRRIAVRGPSAQELQSVLEAKRIRDGGDERAAWSE